MFRSFFTVGGFTLMSRLLGFVRDILVGQYLGAGAAADAWLAAFRFPNLFRRVFGEGAFNAAFVPLYGRRLEEQGDEKADFFASRVLSLMAVTLLAITVIALIFMGPITRLLAMGFEDERFKLAVELSRITAPYMIFICLTAALSGVLNTRRVFAAPAFSYVVLNIVFLVALLVVVPRTGQPEKVLAWSVLVAGVLQMAVVLVSAWRNNARMRPVLPKVDEDVKRLGILMGPGLISAGIQQLNLIVGQAVASYQDGGISYIYYADRVNQLPLGLIGIGFGVVLLPEITRRLRGGNEDGAKDSLARGIELALFFALPAMIAMMVIPVPMMTAIFKGGKFTAEVATQSGYSLLAFASGAPAYILARVLQPAYFAREDTKTPMRFTLISAGVNIVLCIVLFVPMRHVGCALATSIAGWVNVVLLIAGLRRTGFLKVRPGFARRLIGMLLASALMGGGVWWLADYFSAALSGDARMLRLLWLGGVVTAGVFAYVAFALVLRAISVSEIKSAIKRG